MISALRRAVPGDAPTCGRICHDAFGAISDAHNFPRDFPSPEVAAGLLRMLIEHPGFYDVVAERDGEIIGSNFMDERSPILGIGPISVDPAVQNQGVGRRLMQDVIDRAATRRLAWHRLFLQSSRDSRGKVAIADCRGFHTQRRRESPNPKIESVRAGCGFSPDRAIRAG